MEVRSARLRSIKSAGHIGGPTQTAGHAVRIVEEWPAEHRWSPWRQRCLCLGHRLAPQQIEQASPQLPDCLAESVEIRRDPNPDLGGERQPFAQCQRIGGARGSAYSLAASSTNPAYRTSPCSASVAGASATGTTPRPSAARHDQIAVVQ